ncbi:MAG: family ATPase [Deltaproteobacteria bacterium]|nr:family ATPase [Deltaproteobacteria bacterium]
MKCPRCQHDNPAGVKFCGECGARLESACAACGAANPPGNKFCGQCGSLLTQAATSAKFASPETYTPKHLAEKILTSKSALEGERKQVTVLFADMKGSMELLADRDPEEARKLLDPVIEHMMEAVHRYEGTVSNLMGDGIMALFGAPLSHEDHAVRACYAALRMQESVQRYADGVRRTEGVPIQIRVGLNSGEVVVGSIGNDLKMDYTAVGQTVHLAARMEQMATPGSVLMTPDALRLAEGYVQVKPLGPVSVKGLTEPVEVYEVTGVAAARSRLQAAAARGLTRFVGRDAETEQLRKALEQARSDHGQVVGVVGEPGLGKSRLFFEFTHSHRTQGWLILESGSVSYGKATPYLPVIDLLKAYFKIQDRDDHREIREKVTGKLLTLDKSLESTLPAFLALLDVPVDDAAWQALDPSQRRQHTLGAVKRLLLRESQVQPLILLFEDLHWIDSETQAMLESLVESLPTSRLLLLVNYRPEYQHGWGSKTYYTQLRLDPLPPESAGEILNSVLGTDHGLQSLKELLIERTEGNPFFLEESVRTLVETKVLAGERGNYHLEKKVESTQVPATVQAVLAARIDRLPPQGKQLLQSAAVIGKDVPFSLLQAIIELSDEELRRGLTHLQGAEFLYETSLFPDLEYTFKHALTHEVAYGSLLHERQRALHARIVEAIETLHPDRLIEQVERLAHHAFRGELWGKAVAYQRQAGARAAARWAHQEAVVNLEQALVALRHLPQSRETLEQAIDVRLDLRPSLVALADRQATIERLREAQALAETLGDQRRLLRITADIMSYSYLVGDHMSAIESGERALSTATALQDFALQVQINSRLGRAYEFLGNYPRAIEFCRWTIGSLKGDLLYERFGMAAFQAATSRAGLARCAADLGQFDEGVSPGKEAIEIAEAVNHPWSIAMAYWGIGHLYLIKGNLAMAIPLLERAVEVCRLRQVPAQLPRMASSLGQAYLHCGRVSEALALLEEAVKQGVRTGQTIEEALQTAWLSEGYLLAGRTEDAIQSAQRALDLSRTHKERGNEAWVLRLLGELASRHDPPDVEKAEQHYMQAVTLAEELGMRPLIAHCHIGLGKLYRRTGDLEQAKAHLANGVAMMREMEMGLWLERAEAELKELG